MASPVAYLVRRGHLRTCGSYLLLTSLALWGCRSRAPAAPSSQPPAKQAVSKAVAGAARTGGVAIRIPAKGGAPRVYRLPGVVEIPTALRGKLPPVGRVVGLDAEAEFLYVMSPTKDTRDRKSTRLYSSHLVISYAVFCLKKKKKKEIYYMVDTRKHNDTVKRATL